jgi:6-pyruvoyltetrahydropterin/6-carboxytetrahydropterin synthase
MHYSTKRYGHERGLSAVFRQPHADHSHCRFLHGYSLAFTFTFGCKELDNKNWVVDFGGLRKLKDWLEDNFDHKVCLDENDPMLHHFHVLEDAGLCELRFFEGVGAEKFAEHAFNFANKLVKEMTNDRCRCIKVECAEHGSNSAVYVDQGYAG